ncbi:recombinase family protein [Nocardia sp. NBC_01503]|uniref:recombinase family protein n=1 Tax=Nocardia sp. NBC_01503 TaxID=2975997 RepID=UPI002E7C0E0E|nr:recombinase family protein [Nocardia sp. NBC_01503]WTL36114.1 recombinase family protein [Nocardia sp. NBC_01503]
MVLRAIVGARVSKMQGQEKVSHLAQKEDGLRWAAAQGYEVVDTFEDLGVSAGKTTPFERPDLGQWLNPERLHEWDVIVFQKIDRAFRSTRDCVDFAKFIEENKKVLAFSGDGMVLNYRDQASTSFESQMAEFFIYIGSFFAQIELNRFKSRAQDRMSQLKMTDRVSHGVAPFGYRTVPHASGKGKALERDPEAYAVLHEMKDKLLEEHWSLTKLCVWLNEEGKKTAVAKARGSGAWSVTTVRRVLSSLRTQGLKVTRQGGAEHPVLDAQGNVIRMAEPTFSDEDWRRIESVLAAKAKSGKARQMTDNPMAGIGRCLECGYSLSQHRRTVKKKDGSENVHNYIRCGRTPGGCKGAVRLDEVERKISELIEDYTDLEVTKQVFVPGADHTQDLELAEQALKRLRWESDNNLVDDEDLWRSRMASLSTRVRELGTNTVVPAQWETVGTGTTYGELWSDPDTDRRQVLREAGVVVGLRDGKIQVRIPDNWPEPAWVAELRGDEASPPELAGIPEGARQDQA